VITVPFGYAVGVARLNRDVSGAPATTTSLLRPEALVPVDCRMSLSTAAAEDPAKLTSRAGVLR